MKYQISNTYGTLSLDSEDESYSHYTGRVMFSVFLDSLLLCDHKDLATKLRDKWIESQRKINPYIRGYIPEIDDEHGEGLGESYNRWLKEGHEREIS